MINTIQIKQQQLSKGFYTTGSGPAVMLIMGSCRVCPYVEYFHQWNEKNGNQFTIHTLDPFNWNWNGADERVDYEEALLKCETNENILSMLKSVDIFIHEYYQNAGMFNCKIGSEKTIYNFGLSPAKDICIPNWNNLFVLFGDIVSFDMDIRKKSIQDYNVLGKLSDQTEKEIYDISQKNIEKFYEVCRLSDIQEMEDFFKINFTTTRLWWTNNHISKHFTLYIFSVLCKKLSIDLSTDFIDKISEDDMFANNYVYLTAEDVKYYGYTWNEEIKPLREKL